eukprot:TRINITY_DN3848_c0_g3_i1.p3 TRINITY_DN3848_c0_g3~~TRINITY_DN3848_c0_g3_i1.p3  ORF type:complete len:115 (-),score=42.01 TRINITY_DN3848_c0_g3_i1:314-658(-)
MVQEAEEFADQDKKVKARVDARNNLESYCYSMKQTVDDKLADKLDEDEKDKIKQAVSEALEWLDDNQDAEVEEFEDKLKEVQDIAQPIVAKVYQSGDYDVGGEADEDLGDHDEL